jgi:AcrR family transcriptional regulator
MILLNLSIHPPRSKVMANSASVVDRPARTQDQRSAETRGKLLDATIAVLYERGYALTTTTEISERAGVSRGAQLHHFPTKADLVLSALEHLFERRSEEYRQAFAQLPAGVDRASAAIDLLWNMYSGPTFYAWLELVVAARTDPRLREKVRAIAQRFGSTAAQTHQEHFKPTGQFPGLFELAPFFAFAALEGLAIERIFVPDSPHIPAVLETLKRLAPMALEQE